MPDTPCAVDISTEPTALYALHYRCRDACQDPGDPYGRSPDHRCHDVASYPVTKVTAQRIYFHGGTYCTKNERERTYFVSRSAFDAEGRARHRALGDVLHLTPPEIPRRAKPASLSDLRRQMADSHPDRGGDRDTFQAARNRYLAARKTASGPTDND